MTQVRKRIPSTPKQAATRRRPIDKLLDPDVFRALCDPTRLQLIACLAKCGRACSVSEVAECCSVDMSVVSRHLSMLESAGILESTKEGRTVFYRVRFKSFTQSLRDLADAFEDCCPDGSCCTPGGGCGCKP